MNGPLLFIVQQIHIGILVGQRTEVDKYEVSSSHFCCFETIERPERRGP